MARLRSNNQSGILGAALTSGTTSITFGSVPSFNTLTSPDYYTIVLDPGTVSEEIVHLTGYTSGASTGTILRGQEGSGAVAHGSSASWLHGPTVFDYLPASAVFDVKEYGAKGDGITDDTTAMQAALDAANSAGGGRVFVPSGTFLVSNHLVIYANVVLAGAGRGVTILKMATSASQTVVITQGFAGNTGTNNTSSPNEFGIRDLTIDGNAGVNGLPGAQTFGYGMQLYGYGFRIVNVAVRNCNNDGIWSEWANVASVQAPNGVESTLDHVTVHDCGNNGITWRGPHDSRWVNVIVYSANSIGVQIIGNGSALQAVNCHVWACWQQGWSFECTLGAAYLSSCESEGSNSATATPQVYINGQNDVTWMGGNIFCPRNGKVGVKIDGAATGTVFDTKIANATSGGVVFTNDGGHASIRARLYNCTPAYSGTPAVTTRVYLPSSGGAATSNRGPLTAPTVPASTTAQTNTFGVDCSVFVTGGTVTAVAIGGTATGLTSGAFRVPAGQTITLTYSAAPTWTWFGD